MQVGEAPGVEQRRRDVGAPAVAQRHPREQRHGRVDAGLVARGALRGAGGAGGQDHDAGVPLRAGPGRRRGSRAISDSRVSDSSPASPARRPRPRRCGRRRRALASRSAGELLVVDDDPGPLALEHVDQLRAGEGGVEVEQVGAELGDRDGGVDEAAVVAAHDRDGVALADPALGQRAGQRVAAPVHLAEGQRAQLVDDADAVGVEHRDRVEPAGGAGAPGRAAPGRG